MRQHRRSRHQGYSHSMAPTSLHATSPDRFPSLLFKPSCRTISSALATPQVNSTTLIFLSLSLSHITKIIWHDRIGASAHTHAWNKQKENTQLDLSVRDPDISFDRSLHRLIPDPNTLIRGLLSSWPFQSHGNMAWDTPGRFVGRGKPWHRPPFLFL